MGSSLPHEIFDHPHLVLWKFPVETPHRGVSTGSCRSIGSSGFAVERGNSTTGAPKEPFYCPVVASTEQASGADSVLPLKARTSKWYWVLSSRFWIIAPRAPGPSSNSRLVTPW